MDDCTKDVTSTIRKCLFDAASNGDLDKLKNLLQKVRFPKKMLINDGSCPRDYLPTPLSEAARRGHSAVVEELAPYYTEADSLDSGNPIHVACSEGQSNCVIILVKILPHLLNVQAIPQMICYPTYSYEGNGYICLCPIQIAADKGDLTIARILLEAGADVDKRFGKFRIIFRDGTDPNYHVGAKFDALPCAYTALCIASHRGHSAMVELLLNHGADPNLEDFEGACPLSLAARNGHIDALKLLSKAIPFHGKRALIFALNGDRIFHARADPDHKRVECANYLLQNGAPTQDITDEETLRDLWMATFTCRYSPTMDVRRSIETFIKHRQALNILSTHEQKTFCHKVLDIDEGSQRLLLNSGIFELRYSKKSFKFKQTPLIQLMINDLKSFYKQVRRFSKYSFLMGCKNIRPDSETTRSLLLRFYEPWINFNIIEHRLVDYDTIERQLVCESNGKILSLKHLCWWTIRSEIAITQGHISREHIERLGLAAILQRYLRPF